uniref:BON domain-containing protein n=1 Tax=Ningiella ruwaisensis TaxID=2364274 RepID=UPI0010A034A9|nr:BON domain-containing protein [Ningiella ruwaisensis]
MKAKLILSIGAVILIFVTIGMLMNKSDVTYEVTEHTDNNDLQEDHLLPLEARINAAMLSELDVPTFSIDTEIRGSVVILSGEVGSLEEKVRAASVIGDVDGVSEIVNNLQVVEKGVDDAYEPSPM